MPKRPEFSVAPVEAVEEAIEYRFENRALLEEALTHASLDPGSQMERLEFLGDAVLGAVVASMLVRAHPNAPEGELTALKAHLVRRSTLLDVAERWRVADAVRTGLGERDPGGRLRSPSIASDAVEAVIGAVFLDGGWEAAKALIEREWQARIASLRVEDVIDPKTRLQELTQGRGWGLPEYRVEDRGVGKKLRYRAECFVQGEALGVGEAPRKKDAERLAAKQALRKLEEESNA